MKSQLKYFLQLVLMLGVGMWVSKAAALTDLERYHYYKDFLGLGDDGDDFFEGYDGVFFEGNLYDTEYEYEDVLHGEVEVPEVPWDNEFWPKKEDRKKKKGESDTKFVERMLIELVERVRAACEEAYPDADEQTIDDCVFNTIKKIIDKNGDGKIDRDELKDFLKKLLDWGDFYAGMARSKIFKEFDKDKDGYLTDPELERLRKKYFTVNTDNDDNTWH